MADSTTTISQDEINSILWKACDTFRGVVDPSEYKNYILVFLFLKYLSDVWKDRLEQYRQEFKGDAGRVQRRMARERFVLPEGCDFDTLEIGMPLRVDYKAISEDVTIPVFRPAG